MSYFDQASLVMIPSGYKTSKVYSIKPTDGSGDLAFTRSNDTATRVGPDGLLEKVRTNVIPYSQAFENALWSKDGNGTGIAPVVTANNATAPDGTMTADTIVFNAGAGTTTGDSSVVYQAITLTGSATASFYARVTSGTGQLVFRSVAGGTYTTANLTTTWQRFSAAENGSSGFFEIGIRRGLSNEPINASVTVEMWGAQLEAGDIATDYIATTTAAVSVGPVANVPRLDYLNSSCPRLLLEPQRTNLITYSEQFNNAIWNKDNTTLTSGFVSPSGYANAFKLIEQATNAVHSIYQSFPSLSSSVYSATAFVKKGERFKCSLADRNTGAYVSFNLNTGTIIASGTFTGKIEAYGNDWYRVTVTSASALTVIVPQIFVLPDSYTTGLPITLPYVGDGTSGIYIWGAQVEAGAYATSYIPTLGAAVTRGADAASKTGISSLIGQTEGTGYVEFDFNGKYSASGVIALHLAGNAGKNIYFGVGTNNEFFYEVQDTSYVVSITGFFTTQGTKKVAFAYKENDFVLYINGVQIGTDTSGTVPALSEVYLGALKANSNYNLSSTISQALVFKTRLSNSELAALTA